MRQDGPILDAASLTRKKQNTLGSRDPKAIDRGKPGNDIDGVRYYFVFHIVFIF